MKKRNQQPQPMVNNPNAGMASGMQANMMQGPGMNRNGYPASMNPSGNPQMMQASVTMPMQSAPAPTPSAYSYGFVSNTPDNLYDPARVANPNLNYEPARRVSNRTSSAGGYNPAVVEPNWNAYTLAAEPSRTAGPAASSPNGQPDSSPVETVKLNCTKETEMVLIFELIKTANTPGTERVDQAYACLSALEKREIDLNALRAALKL